MTPKRTAAYLGGASLLAAWLASAAGLVSREPAIQETAQPVQTAGTETLAADVQAQTERLRQRLAAAPAPQEPFRNPFAFSTRPEAPARPSARSAEPPAPPPPLMSEPPLILIGIAESQTPEGLARTAMIATAAAELITVTRGEAVVGRYRVDVVEADAVVLSDLSTGALRRLALRD